MWQVGMGAAVSAGQRWLYEGKGQAARGFGYARLCVWLTAHAARMGNCLGEGEGLANP
jgi:hypothetical protein